MQALLVSDLQNATGRVSRESLRWCLVVRRWPRWPASVRGNASVLFEACRNCPDNLGRAGREDMQVAQVLLGNGRHHTKVEYRGPSGPLQVHGQEILDASSFPRPLFRAAFFVLSQILCMTLPRQVVPGRDRMISRRCSEQLLFLGPEDATMHLLPRRRRTSSGRGLRFWAAIDPPTSASNFSVPRLWSCDRVAAPGSI